MTSTPAEVQSFRLLDLPPELLGQVCEHLDDKDLQSIRRVSKAFSVHSMTAFGQRFFDHLIVILHPISLTIFLEIARHSYLSKFVRRVSVSGEQLGPSMTPVQDQALHEDLQQSVERSGLDEIVLERAFAALTNLETIRIDTEQFFCGSATTNHYPGLRCGLTQMLKQEIPIFEWKNPLAKHGHSRVYGLVLGVLKTSSVFARASLELSFWARTCDNSNSNVSAYFDIHSPIWRHQASEKLKYLHSMGDVEPTWICALLQSISDVNRLELSFPEVEHGRMFYGFTGSFYWPNLTQLRLEELTTSHSTFLKFLMVHQDTLDFIWFSMIGFSKGTWSEPLAAILKMPNLRFLFLQMLLERESYKSPDFPDEESYFGESNVNVAGRGDVVCTMEALCGPMATVPNRYDLVEGREGEFYPFEVDLMLGIAATYESWSLSESEDSEVT